MRLNDILIDIYTADGVLEELEGTACYAGLLLTPAWGLDFDQHDSPRNRHINNKPYIYLTGLIHGTVSIWI